MRTAQHMGVPVFPHHFGRRGVALGAAAALITGAHDLDFFPDKLLSHCQKNVRNAPAADVHTVSVEEPDDARFARPRIILQRHHSSLQFGPEFAQVVAFGQRRHITLAFAFRVIHLALEADIPRHDPNVSDGDRRGPFVARVGGKLGNIQRAMPHLVHFQIRLAAASGARLPTLPGFRVPVSFDPLAALLAGMIPGLVPRSLRALRVRVLRRFLFRSLAAAIAFAPFLSLQLRFEKLVAPPRFLQFCVQPLDEVEQVAQQLFDSFAGSLDPGDNLVNGGFELVFAHSRFSWSGMFVPLKPLDASQCFGNPKFLEILKFLKT